MAVSRIASVQSQEVVANWLPFRENAALAMGSVWVCSWKSNR